MGGDLGERPAGAGMNTAARTHVVAEKERGGSRETRCCNAHPSRGAVTAAREAACQAGASPDKGIGIALEWCTASDHIACTAPHGARPCRARLLAEKVGRFRNKNASASGKARLGQDDRQPASGDRAWIEQASPVSTEDAPFLWSAPQQPIGALFSLLLQNLEIINANGMPFSVLTFPHHQIFPCIALPADAALPTLIWRKLAPALCAGKGRLAIPMPTSPIDTDINLRFQPTTSCRKLERHITKQCEKPSKIKNPSNMNRKT